MRLQDMSLGKKLATSIALLVFPILLSVYFLISEKDGLIAFTQQEIAGVHYLRALQQGYVSATALSYDKAASRAAATLIVKAEAQDQGTLALTQKSQELVTVLETGKAADAAAKLSEAISLASDGSNITLDPDTDAYFIGDMLVNQSETILSKTLDMVVAARSLQSSHTEDAAMDFAVARDELATASGNYTTDFGKAVKGNSDGSLDKNLSGAVKKVADATDALNKAAANNDYAAVVALSSAVPDAVQAALPRLDDEMERLLQARIDGYHDVLYERVTVSVLFALLGILVAGFVVRSVSRPIGKIVGAMERISGGDFSDLNLDEDRRDEVGRLIGATEAFRKSAQAAEKAKAEEAAHQQSELQRAQMLSELTSDFSESVRKVIATLHASVEEVGLSGSSIAKEAETVSATAVSIAATSEQSSGNVQTVAAASEELSASIREIADRVREASTTADKATHEAQQARDIVGTLSEATTKIGEVVSLITDIAAQTNLLALNATIEAARAGEAGKGFSVVASEVKTLANQTSHATEDITQHIGSIQVAVKNVITAIEGIDNTIEKVNEVSASIAAAIEQQGVATQEIASNVQQAATGTADVNVNIQRVAGLASDAKDASLNVLSSVKKLEEAAGTIDRDISSYISSVKSL